MSTVEVLKRARDLLVTKGWTQGEMARDALGRFVPPRWETASQFCALGAVSLCSTCAEEHDALRALNAALPVGAFTESHLQPVAYFNDRIATSVDDVLALFDRAILKAEQGA